MKYWVFILTAILLAACSEQAFDEQHVAYLADRGWEVHDFEGDAGAAGQTITLDFPEEMLENYDASGVTFFREHLNEVVVRYDYVLKQKDVEGERIKAYLYELDGEIIGGQGVLPSWIPGNFHLDDQDRVRKEEMLQQ